MQKRSIVWRLGYIAAMVGSWVAIVGAAIVSGGGKYRVTGADLMMTWILAGSAVALVILAIFCLPKHLRSAQSFFPIVMFLVVGSTSAILAPVFTSARAARLSICRSNVREISTAMQMYSADWDDRLPSAENWEIALFPHLANGMPKCPVATTTRSYAMNEALSRVGQWEIRKPSQTVLIFECERDTPSPRGGKDQMKIWHGSRVNVGFIDLSVLAIDPKESPGPIVWQP